MSSPEPRAAFLEAGRFVSSLLNHERLAARWTEPSALPGFSTGGLAGHVYAATRRLEVALDEVLPDAPAMVDLASFYGVNRVGVPAELEQGLHPLIREDGENRAKAGPEGLSARFGALIGRLGARLPTEPDDRLVPIIQVRNGVTPLKTYLRTRVVELVVHGDDLAASLDVVTPAVPASATAVAIEALLEVTRARVGDLEVVRAMSRRERSGEDTLRAL